MKLLCKKGEEHLGDNLKKQCIDYINNLEKENERLKQWDNNKDSRNSRQRIENKKLLEKNKKLQNNWNELKENYNAVLRQRDDTNKSAVHIIEKYHYQWNELKKYIEKEKDRLIKGTSNTYEDSLGKINYVNEDIYIKLVKVLNKMTELERGEE